MTSTDNTSKPLKTVERSLELDEIIHNLIHIGYVNGYNQLAQMAQVAPYNHIEPITVDEAKADLYQLMLSLKPKTREGTIELGSYKESEIEQIEEDAGYILVYRHGYNQAIKEWEAKLSEHFNGEGE